MTDAHGTPPPLQWGSGIPGIPSIWDTPTTPTTGQPVGPPPATRRPSHGRTAPRVVLAAVAVSAAAVVLGGFVMSAGPAVVSAPAVDVAYPAPEGPPLGLPGLPPPVAGAAGPSAVRSDTGGEPFGLLLGTPVAFHDGSGAVLDVVPVDAGGSDGFVVGVTLTTRTDSPGPALVPALALRTPDGREQGWTAASSTGGVPSVLEPGEQWVATLVFPAAPDGGVLVLRDGEAFAGWVVPAAG